MKKITIITALLISSIGLKAQSFKWAYGTTIHISDSVILMDSKQGLNELIVTNKSKSGASFVYNLEATDSYKQRMTLIPIPNNKKKYVIKYDMIDSFTDKLTTTLMRVTLLKD